MSSPGAGPRVYDLCPNGAWGDDRGAGDYGRSLAAAVLAALLTNLAAAVLFRDAWDWVVAVGGTGVAVGGTGVAVGGTGVAVGGTGVAVGGTGVAVGGTGVAVAGMGVAVGIDVLLAMAVLAMAVLAMAVLVASTGHHLGL